MEPACESLEHGVEVRGRGTKLSDDAVHAGGRAAAASAVGARITELPGTNALPAARRTLLDGLLHAADSAAALRAFEILLGDQWTITLHGDIKIILKRERDGGLQREIDLPGADERVEAARVREVDRRYLMALIRVNDSAERTSARGRLNGNPVFGLRLPGGQKGRRD